MSKAVVGMAEASPSPRPPPKVRSDDLYEAYMVSHGIRYLNTNMAHRKILFRQFIQVFTSAFKNKSKRGKHGYIWQLDFKLVRHLIKPIHRGFVPGLTLRQTTASGELVIPPKNPLPEAESTLIVSEELDEVQTIILIAKHLLVELFTSYDPDWPEFNGIELGKNVPALLGFIELLGLYKSGNDFPVSIVDHLRKEAAAPRLVPNLFIRFECACPTHLILDPAIPPPINQGTAPRELKTIEVHDFYNHLSEYDIDECYLCNPQSTLSRQLEPEAHILRDRILLVRGAEYARPSDTMEPFNRNRARQRIVSYEADEHRRRRRSGRGPRSPRFTATGATWQNPKWALRLTTKALADARFPIKDMRALCGPKSPFDLVKMFGKAEIGEDAEGVKEGEKMMGEENMVGGNGKGKGKGKEEAVDENGVSKKPNGGEKADDENEANAQDKAKAKANSSRTMDKGKSKSKAREVHHVRWLGNSLAVLAESYASAHRDRILREWQMKTAEERRQTVQEYRDRLGGQGDQDGEGDQQGQADQGDQQDQQDHGGQEDQGTQGD